MPTYVIATQDCDFLDTPVFSAGPTGGEEAVAVFTDRSAAQEYIRQANWGDEYEVGQLDDLQLLRWIVKAHEQGTHYMAIDPDRQRQLAGERLDVIVIEEMLADFAESLTRDILHSAE